MPRVILIGGSGQVATRACTSAAAARHRSVSARPRPSSTSPGSDDGGRRDRRRAPATSSSTPPPTPPSTGPRTSPSCACAVNRDGPPARVAAAAARAGVPIIHVSTDYVFDGAKSTRLRRDRSDRRRWVSTARSKLAGEAASRAANPRHVILRTAWVFSADGATSSRPCCGWPASGPSSGWSTTSAAARRRRRHRRGDRCAIARDLRDRSRPARRHSASSIWSSRRRDDLVRLRRARSWPARRARRARRLPVRRDRHGRLSDPGAPAGQLRLDTSSSRASFGIACRHWRRRPRRTVSTACCGPHP